MSNKLQVADGYVVARGAMNIECGFHPRWVFIANLKQATETFYFKATDEILQFDSGGSTTADMEIKAGYTIRASDGGWQGIVGEVVLDQGTWAGGNAEGYIVFEPGTLTGAANIADNDTIRASTQRDGEPSGDWATVDSAGLKGFNFDLDTELGTGAANVTITPYDGTSAGNSKGFSIGSALGTDGDLLYWQAFGSGAG